jgi:hypothetical protein
MQRNDRPSRPVNRGDLHLDGFVKLRILAGVVGRTSARDAPLADGLAQSPRCRGHEELPDGGGLAADSRAARVAPRR